MNAGTSRTGGFFFVPRVATVYDVLRFRASFVFPAVPGATIFGGLLPAGRFACARLRCRVSMRLMTCGACSSAGCSTISLPAILDSMSCWSYS